MAENKDTYVFTIENDTEKSMITSVKKGENELLKNNLNINLDDVDRASADLKNVINPAIPPVASEPQPEVVVAAEPQPPQPAAPPPPADAEPQPAPPPPPADAEPQPAAEEPQQDVAAAKPVPESDLTNAPISIRGKGKRTKLNYDGDIYDLLQQIPKSTTLTDKQKSSLIEVITDESVPIKKKIEENIPLEFKKTNAAFKNNVLQGGTHHTRKRTHKPRNTKSNTRKGQLYRKIHRRTHGRKAGNGKKQTRRIVNH